MLATTARESDFPKSGLQIRSQPTQGYKQCMNYKHYPENSLILHLHCALKEPSGNQTRGSTQYIETIYNKILNIYAYMNNVFC